MNTPFFKKDLFGNELVNTFKENLCEKCGLYKKCLSPKMQYTGNGKKEVLIIAEAPGRTEDEQNKQLIGQAGQLLRKFLIALDVNLDEDCWKTNAIICRPEGNRTPTYQEIKYCRGNLINTIKKLKPKKIITLGKVALESLIGEKESITEMEKWIGWEIPDQEYKCFIYPTFHPSYILRNEKNEVLERIFINNLWKAFISKSVFKEYKPVVTICDEQKAIEYLSDLNGTIAIDFETSGIKPHKKGHFIYSASITKSDFFTFSFLITDKIKDELNKVLANDKIKKVIHNSQFELKWAAHFLTEIKGEIIDTQLLTHIIDNREGITGLKFQTYVNFGISSYEESIKKYLETSKKGSNEFNNIKEADVNDLLTYNGYDTYFTMLLYRKYWNKLDEHLLKGFHFYNKSNFELSKLSGIHFDYKMYENNYEELTNKIDDLHNKIMNSKELNVLENKASFNYNSDKQLRELLFDKLKWKNNNLTKKGQFSVNESSLIELNQEFTNSILERRKFIKIRNTYLEQFSREVVEMDNDYYIFPNFSLNNVRTYRSASQNPNFQNIPARNEVAKKMTRTCIIPRKDRLLLEIDFKGMEVGVSCIYHNDPIMINYVINNGDMHGDIAKQLYIKNDYTKYERYTAKNGFVFPSFYGSTARIFSDQHKLQGYGDITENLWDMMKQETKDHLSTKAINSIYDFQMHVEKIEKDFWNNRFKVYKQWKLDNWQFYKDNGYVELKTGFRCVSVMSFNDVNNYPIQGTAYHIAQNVLNKTNQFLRENNFKSVLVGEVHDSGLFDVCPHELDNLIKIIKEKIVEVKREWSWINVPLQIEAAATEINGNWNEKKEIKI